MKFSRFESSYAGPHLYKKQINVKVVVTVVHFDDFLLQSSCEAQVEPAVTQIGTKYKVRIDDDKSKLHGMFTEKIHNEIRVHNFRAVEKTVLQF